MRGLAIFVVAGALLGLLWLVAFGPDEAAAEPDVGLLRDPATGAPPAELSESPLSAVEPEASRLEVGAPQAPDTASRRPPAALAATRDDVLATGWLEGRVYDLDGEPLLGEVEVQAYVQLADYSNRNYSGVGRHGRYRIDGIPPGVVRDVWVGVSERVGSQPALVEIRAGVGAQLDVFVRAGVRVSGTVVSAGDGTPIEGVSVSMDRVASDGVGRSVTDFEGRFELSGVRVVPHVDDEGTEWVMVDLEVADDGFSKPRTTRYLSPPRDDDHYEFEVELASLGATLVGRTHRAALGVTQSTATVVALDAHGWTYSELCVEGQFRFEDLPPGEVALVAFTGGMSGLLFTSTRLELPADEVTFVDLVLSSAQQTALEGRVVAPGDDEISLHAIGLSVMPILENNGLSTQIPSFSTTGITEPDGTFRVGGVLPGRSWVSLELGRRARDEDLRVFPERLEVEVPSGEVLRGLEFRLLPGFWVSGFVDASEPELARLSLELEDEGGEVVAEARPRTDGGFEFEAVEPAAYTLVLVEGARRIAEREVAPGLVEEVYLRYE